MAAEAGLPLNLPLAMSAHVLAGQQPALESADVSGPKPARHRCIPTRSWCV